MLSRLFAWSTIAGELGLSFSLLSRWSSTAVWIGVLFHTGLLFLTGRTFGMFYYAALASYLSFLEWPRDRVTVLYDRESAWCRSTRRFFEAITLEPIADWVPSETPDGLHGKRIHALVDGRICKGFAAIKLLLLYNPVVYFVIATVLAVPEPAGFPYRRWIAALLWIVFAPLISSCFMPFVSAILTRDGRSPARMKWSRAWVHSGMKSNSGRRNTGCTP
jgi:hypothetical protein